MEWEGILECSIRSGGLGVVECDAETEGFEGSCVGGDGPGVFCEGVLHASYVCC